MAADGSQSVESRKRALRQEMRHVLSKLREIPYFRLDDYIVPKHSPDSLPAEAERQGRRFERGPLYVARRVAPCLSQAEAKRIQTYNPTDS